MSRYSPPQQRKPIQNGENSLKDGTAAALAGFDETEDGAEYITSGSDFEAGRHLLAVFCFAKITLAHVAAEGAAKTPEKRQMAVPVFLKK